MILELTEWTPAKGRLKQRIWQIIKVYINQCNADKLANNLKPSQLEKYIENLTQYQEYSHQLLYAWDENKLTIHFKDDPINIFCEIRWINEP